MTRRGEVWDERLDQPPVGSEQGGARPSVIVSNDLINSRSPVLLIVPFTSARGRAYVYPSQVRVPAGNGGLTADSIALGEQLRAVDRSRLLRRRGVLSAAALTGVEQAYFDTLDAPLPEQPAPCRRARRRLSSRQSRGALPCVVAMSRCAAFPEPALPAYAGVGSSGPGERLNRDGLSS